MRCKESEVRHLSDSFLAGVLIGALVGLIGCEEQVRTDPEPTVQTEENDSVTAPAPVEKGPAAKENVRIEQIKLAVELDSLPGPLADNSRCHACHANFKNEALTSVHAQANIGCTRCHGASDAHRSDEDTVTPPDVMFPKAKITSFCTGCHTGDPMNIPAHQAVLTQADPPKSYCTDCHGEHRLNYRTRKWDKTTRNLIKDDRVLKLSDEIK
jgi:hypothetical protein